MAELHPEVASQPARARQIMLLIVGLLLVWLPIETFNAGLGPFKHLIWGDSIRDLYQVLYVGVFASVLGTILAGYLADRFGWGRPFFIGALLSALGLGFLALGSSLGFRIIEQVLSSMGGAFFNIAKFIIIFSLVNSRRIDSILLGISGAIKQAVYIFAVPLFGLFIGEESESLLFRVGFASIALMTVAVFILFTKTKILEKPAHKQTRNTNPGAIRLIFIAGVLLSLVAQMGLSIFSLLSYENLGSAMTVGALYTIGSVLSLILVSVAFVPDLLEYLIWRSQKIYIGRAAFASFGILFSIVGWTLIGSGTGLQMERLTSIYAFWTIGSQMVSFCLLSLLVFNAPKNKRGSYIGWYLAATSIGSWAASSATGWIGDYQAIKLIAIATLVVAVIVLIRYIVKQINTSTRAPEEPETIDADDVITLSGDT